MNEFERVFAQIVQTQKNAQTHTDTDYEKDGFAHCGKCHEPKEFVLKMPEGFLRPERIAPRLCRCEREAYEQEQAAFKRQQEMAALERIRSASLMDSGLKAATFEAFTQTKNNQRAFTLCKNYAATFEDVMEPASQGMLFYGEPGTGKTYAAACIANELMQKHVTVMLTSTVKLLRIAYEGGERWFHTLAGLIKARLVIIDDLGAERGTDTAMEHIYGAIDDRYRAKKPVIYTTNLQPQAIKAIERSKDPRDMQGRRIFDRVLETCYPVEFIGDAWRKDEASKRYSAMRELEKGL